MCVILDENTINEKLMNIFSKLFGKTKNENIDSDLNIKNFKSVSSFWEFVVSTDNWYSKYSPYKIKNINNYISELAPLIIQSTNELRKKMEFSYEEYEQIVYWDNFLIRIDMDESNKFKLNKSLTFKQYCSNCKKEIGFQQRYPKLICGECLSKITDKNNRLVEFFNTEGLGYGCQGYYCETQQKEKYNSDICFLEGKEYFAEEGRFGGIVIQLKE